MPTSSPDVRWCPRCARYHQNRNHPVPCSGCRRKTLDPHALCDACWYEANAVEATPESVAGLFAEDRA